jgi:hypothetical protein
MSTSSSGRRGLGAVRHLLADSPGSLGGRARARRWDLARTVFPDLESCRVIDLGGTVEAWRRAPVRPAHITVLNLFEPGESDEDWITPLTGDACRALDVPGVSADGYDLVFSNSLMEHVGGHAQRVLLAECVRALAPRHWVQTPYRYFPVEPHWIFPGMQFLPTATRARIAASWPLGHTPSGSFEESLSTVQWTELIGLAQMRSYFPDSQIVKERFAGLTKSLVAIRTS